MRVLPTATLNPNSMPGKAEREQFNDLYDRAWGTALAQNPPPVTVPPEWIPTVAEPLTPWPTDPRIPAGAGWISNVQGPRPFPLVAKVYNFWVERTDDDGIIVYAGSLYDNAAQGTLLIQRLNEFGPIDAEPEIYTAPQQAGGIRIVDAIGERLTLRADDGTLFYFDVLTRQWVGTPPSPAPSPPTHTPGRRPAAPTFTPVIGMLPGCLPFGNGAGIPYNCWQGLVNGQLLILKAGVGGYGHDQTQGFVWVNTPEQREDGSDIYFTPQQIGPVKIVSVNGLIFTLAPAEPGFPPVTFVFDLATRQWVTPGPTPVPSLPPSPGP